MRYKVPSYFLKDLDNAKKKKERIWRGNHGHRYSCLCNAPGAISLGFYAILTYLSTSVTWKRKVNKKNNKVLCSGQGRDPCSSCNQLTVVVFWLIGVLKNMFKAFLQNLLLLRPRKMSNGSSDTFAAVLHT